MVINNPPVALALNAPCLATMETARSSRGEAVAAAAETVVLIDHGMHSHGNALGDSSKFQQPFERDHR